MSIRPWPFSLATVAVLVSCTSNPVCACDPVIPSARIHGVVQGPGGAAVPGARVTAQASSAACAAPFYLIGEGFTDADGRFHAEVLRGDPRFSGVCLRAFATPPAGSTLRGSDTVAFTVRFAADAPLDSARVDLALRAP
ncbi:MAG TPA: hypothetical protein VE871_20070 [Longimicrobium sp.]|nr:hypothetical protein [Longimicrobium sp.]